jgi:hypothetical protein
MSILVNIGGVEMAKRHNLFRAESLLRHNQKFLSKLMLSA